MGKAVKGAVGLVLIAAGPFVPGGAWLTSLGLSSFKHRDRSGRLWVACETRNCGSRNPAHAVQK